jgi:hypothetical protein
MHLSQAQRAVIIGALAIIAVLIVTFVVIIVTAPPPAQMSSSTSITAQRATATPRRPTVTPSPTTPPLSLAQLMSVCGFDQQTALHAVQIGDLAFAQLSLGPLTYPGIMLPDDWSTAHPHQVTTNAYGPLPGQTPANPLNGQAGMYSWTICNISTSHAPILRQVSLQIVSVTLDSAQPDIQKPCDTPFDSLKRNGGFGGCGGSIASGPDIFNATWPAQVANGTTIILKETATANAVVGIAPAYGAFPVTLKPHTAIMLGITMTTPPAGLYTFAPGITLNNSSTPIFPSNAGAPTFFAGNAHFWGGQGCMQSKTMQAQIPKSGPESYWVCPEQPGF